MLVTRSIHGKCKGSASVGLETRNIAFAAVRLPYCLSSGFRSILTVVVIVIRGRRLSRSLRLGGLYTQFSVELCFLRLVEVTCVLLLYFGEGYGIIGISFDLNILLSLFLGSFLRIRYR